MSTIKNFLKGNAASFIFAGGVMFALISFYNRTQNDNELIKLQSEQIIEQRKKIGVLEDLSEYHRQTIQRIHDERYKVERENIDLKYDKGPQFHKLPVTSVREVFDSIHHPKSDISQYNVFMNNRLSSPSAYLEVPVTGPQDHLIRVTFVNKNFDLAGAAEHEVMLGSSGGNIVYSRYWKNSKYMSDKLVLKPKEEKPKTTPPVKTYIPMGSPEGQQLLNKPAAQLDKEMGSELSAIRTAAARNNCDGDLLVLLCAIRKTENGRAGREFGVLAPRAIDTNLDTQAGWAAATVVKNYDRWKAAGKTGDFITYLGKVYCPVGAENDPTGLNRHWISNTTRWYEKLGGTQATVSSTTLATVTVTAATAPTR